MGDILLVNIYVFLYYHYVSKAVQMMIIHACSMYIRMYTMCTYIIFENYTEIKIKVLLCVTHFKSLS